MATAFDLLAHAVPFSYRFPLPIWIYVVGGGAAVLASAPAAALAVRGEPGPPLRSRDLYPPLHRLKLGPLGLALTSLLLVWGLAGSIGGRSAQAHEFFENPLTILVWVDFWVGLGILSAFVGNLWDFVSPLNAGARLLDRTLARLDISPVPYPARLGRWPAVAVLLLWSWAELVWGPAKHPETLAAVLIGYFLVTLAAVALFGAEAWLGNGELFTVFARTFARFAPLELTPASPDEWLGTPPTERRVRLRPYGAGLRSEAGLPPGGGAFVLVLLATVVYDGFSQTTRYHDVFNWFGEHSGWLRAHEDVVNTGLMLGIALAFVLAFVLICALIVGPDGNVGDAFRRYAPTLIPIAAVYFAAHYFSYLLLVGQLTLGVLVDPFGKSWNPAGLGEYPIWRGIAPAVLVWWAQIVLIVGGHVIAVFAAHRVALRGHRRRVSPLLAQIPLVLLMVAYTMAGLWVLAQQIKA